MITIKCNKDCTFRIARENFKCIEEREIDVIITFKNGDFEVRDKDETYMFLEEN